VSSVEGFVAMDGAEQRLEREHDPRTRILVSMPLRGQEDMRSSWLMIG